MCIRSNQISGGRTPLQGIRLAKQGGVGVQVHKLNRSMCCISRYKVLLQNIDLKCNKYLEEAVVTVLSQLSPCTSRLNEMPYILFRPNISSTYVRHKNETTGYAEITKLSFILFAMQEGGKRYTQQ